MSYFPVCMDLRGKTVLLVGNGKQIQDKAEKMRPFGAKLVRQDTFTRTDAETAPALVIVGDLPVSEAEQISDLCGQYRIPVNVVDVPRLCSFYFPALITRGELTVAVSTGGTGPAAAAYLRREMEQVIPDRTEEILAWLSANRGDLRQRGILKQAVAAAFARNRPLTEQELWELQNG